MKTMYLPRISISLVFGLLLTLVAGSARAGTHTWTGGAGSGDKKWSTASNWQNSIKPVVIGGQATIIVFGSGTDSICDMTITINQLRFTGGGNLVKGNGSATLTMNTLGISPHLINGGTAENTLGGTTGAEKLNILMTGSGSQFWRIASGSILRMNAVVTGSAIDVAGADDTHQAGTLILASPNSSYGTVSMGSGLLQIAKPPVGSVTANFIIGDNSLLSTATTRDFRARMEMLDSDILDDQATIDVQRNGTLDMKGKTETFAQVIVQGLMVIGDGGNVTISSGSATSSVTAGTAGTSPVGIVTVGAATLTLSGQTSVTGGTINLGSTNGAGQLVINNTFLLAGGLIESNGNASNVVKLLTGMTALSNAQGQAKIHCKVDLGGGIRTISVTGINQLPQADFVIDGQIIDSTGGGGSGTGGILKQGLGIMLMTSTLANKYTGVTQVDLGVLQVNNTGTPAAADIGKAIVGDLIVGNGNARDLSNFGILQTLAKNQLSHDSAITFSRSGELDIGAFEETVDTISNTTGTINTALDGKFSFGMDNLDITFSGLIVGQGSLIKQGTGVFTFAGSSTSTGTLTIEKGTAILNSTVSNKGSPLNVIVGTGTGPALDVKLKLGAANQLPDNGTLFIKSDGQFDLNTFNDKVGTATVDHAGVANPTSGDIAIGASQFEVATLLDMTGGSVVATAGGNLVLSGNVKAKSSTLINAPVSLNAVVVFTVDPIGAAPQLTVKKTIGDGPSPQTHSLTKTGFGTMKIDDTTSNTYLGTTTVDRGTLELNHTTGLSLPGDVVIGNATDPADSATIVTDADGQMNPTKTLTVNASGRFDLGGRNETFAALAGGGGKVVLGGNTFTVGDSTSTQYSGDISGAGNFVKVGSGTLTLTGVNSLTGATSVQEGKLEVNGSLTGSAITVGSIASLGGSGTVGMVMASAATVLPGFLAGGSLQSIGDVILSNGSLNIALDDTTAQLSNRIAVGGAFNIDTTTLNLNVTGTPTKPVYLIASYGSLPTASFGSVSPSLPSGYQLIYNFDNHVNKRNIALIKPVITMAPTNVSAGEATFNGIATLPGDAAITHAYFEYKKGTEAYAQILPKTDFLAGATDSVPMSKRLNLLEPGATYTYRLVLETTGGILPGAEQTFTLVDAPVVVTLPAEAVTAAGAKLKGTVGPAGGNIVNYYFEYGLTSAYGTKTPSAESRLGTTSTVFKAITGLTGGRTYHYRIVGFYANDQNYYGEDVTFATPGPLATTLAATPVSALSATAKGTVNPRGKATTAYVEYGLTTSYGLKSAVVNVGSGTLVQNVSFPLKSLAFNKLYHFRVVATSADGTAKGDDLTFTTLPVTKPVISSPPVSKFVALGTSVTLSVTLSESPPTDSVPTFQWRKNNVAVAGATSAKYIIPAVAVTHAGAYDCVIKNASSTIPANITTTTPVQLGVVDTAIKPLNLAEGAKATMAVASGGNGLTLTWAKGSGGLPQNGHFPLSADHKTLTITPLVAGDTSPGDSDTYTCTVASSFTSTSLVATFKLKVFNSIPVITKPVVLPDGMVSAPYSFKIPVSSDGSTNSAQAPTSYAMTPAIPGLTLNTTTGVISGKPTTASKLDTMLAYIPTRVTLTASNVKGKDFTTVDLIIKALPSPVVGTFNGLVARNPGLGAGNGGKINVIMATKGTFTGTLAIGAESLSFMGTLDATTPAAPPTVTNLQVKRVPATLPPYILNLSFDGTTGKMTGDVTDGIVTPAVLVDGYVNPMTRPDKVAIPTALVTTYTAALDITNTSLIGTGVGHETNVAYPQGNGYGIMKVTSAGLVSWSGKMGDGVAASFSTTIASDGSIPLHMMLYTNTGSAHGWIQATPGMGNALLDGTIDWNKADPGQIVNTDRVYGDGFPKHDLTVVGGKYIAPAPNTQVLGLATARLLFTEGGIAGPAPITASAMAGNLDLSVTVSTANAATITTANPATVTLKLLPLTGDFNGGFNLKEANGTQARPVLYSGVIVSRLSKGVGNFVLNQLPSVTLGTTLLTSPKLSGQVVFEHP